MKKEGFYLLESPHKEHFEHIVYTINFFADCLVSLTFSDRKEQTKEGKIFTFLLNHYKIVKRKKEYYLKVKIKNGEGKFIFEEIGGPVPQIQAEKFFIPFRIYLEQKMKRKKLSKFLLSVLANKSGELMMARVDCMKIICDKMEAVKAQTFEKAANLRDMENNQLDKMFLIVKEKIKEARGFKWVTDAHIRYIIAKELV